ncbi:Nucleotide-diphospho-sugar transferase family protein [Rhynchospora pubera]|uniref:Glycosyltransferase n=1 Tax=Rhynchospora pubera TaxID=906938 RepID=A0AAV8GB74_9POAL|nr:Nucleotide-diphospho-sugar transferase family protein [Rhynchospora pubera]
MVTAADPSGEGGDFFELRRLVNPILLLIAVTLPCAILYQVLSPVDPTASSLGFLPTVVPAVNSIDLAHLEGEDARLERVLREAAMEHKTIILTTLNAAWSSPGSVIDLYIESFRTGEGTRRLLDHLVIVTLDMKAYARCLSIHTHCFVLLTEGVDFSEQKDFLTDGYLKMMWRRIDFLRVVLEKGYNFIFSDADIMWFRNPLPHFRQDVDFQIACDHFTGNSSDIGNRPNGGFKYVKSNNRTIEFYKFWYYSREMYPGYHDQDVLNFIKQDPFITEIGINISFLSTDYFGGICEPSRDFRKVCTMHANCCIGLPSKVNDLRVMIDDWRKYRSLAPEAKQLDDYSWRVPQNCSASFSRKNSTRE